MNTTRLAARRAKPISWVTTTIVMPSRASPIMTSRTSLIISGSRADVGSSNSMTFGSIARARALEQFPGALLRLALRHPPDLDRAEGDVLQDRLVREEVEALEHHADVAAQAGELLALLGHLLAVDGDLALLDRLQAVDRAAQRRLA